MHNIWLSAGRYDSASVLTVDGQEIDVKVLVIAHLCEVADS